MVVRLITKPTHRLSSPPTSSWSGRQWVPRDNWLMSASLAETLTTRGPSTEKNGFGGGWLFIWPDPQKGVGQPVLMQGDITGRPAIGGAQSSTVHGPPFDIVNSQPAVGKRNRQAGDQGDKRAAMAVRAIFTHARQYAIRKGPGSRGTRQAIQGTFFGWCRIGGRTAGVPRCWSRPMAFIGFGWPPAGGRRIHRPAAAGRLSGQGNPAVFIAAVSRCRLRRVPGARDG